MSFYQMRPGTKAQSAIPGMNDWTPGLGSFQESKDGFPHGMKNLRCRMPCGLEIRIVGGSNVDAARWNLGRFHWIGGDDRRKMLGAMHRLSP